MDTIPRRNRYADRFNNVFVPERDRIIKPDQLLDNDIEKLALLEPSLNFKYLSTRWIAYFNGGNIARVSNRLLALRVPGNQYVDLDEMQLNTPNSLNKEFVYSIYPAGLRALRDRGYPMLAAHHRSHSTFHEMDVDMGFYAPLRYAADHDQSLRLTTAADLLKHAHTPKQTREDMRDPFGFRLNPKDAKSKKRRFDGPPFIISRPSADGRMHNLCVPGIEVDRNANEDIISDNMARTTIGSHILEIVEFKKKGLQDHYLGFGDKMFVPIVVAHRSPARAEARMQNIMTWVKNELGPIGYIGFQTMPDIPMLRGYPAPNGDIITSPWKRVGHPDLIMSKV